MLPALRFKSSVYAIRKKHCGSKYRVDNPQKSADATRTAMQKYRLGNPKKAAAAVQNYRLHNPAYSKAQNTLLVSAHYHKNTKQSRLLSRTSTARHYIKNWHTSCLKSRRSSQKYYEKESSAIKARRRRYLLVEPTNEEVNRLMTTLQDTLCRDKAVVDEILEGLKNLGTWGTKNVNPIKCPHVN